MDVEASPAQTEWQYYQELKRVIDADERYAPLARLLAIYVYTCAYKGVRIGMDAFITALNAREGAITQKDTMLLQNAHDVIGVYTKILVELNEKVKEHWLAWHKREEESPKTELNNAMSKFLLHNGSFSLEDLLRHMERNYSEKKLLKYVGPIPLYKDVLMFTREAIEKKLEQCVREGTVLAAKPFSQEEKKARKEQGEEARFISLSYAYSLFYWQWDPTLFDSKTEGALHEIERVMQEILGCQISNLQSAKILRLLFKDSEADKERILTNFAKILALYHKQMNEPLPGFLRVTDGRVRLVLGEPEAAGKEASEAKEFQPTAGGA